MVTGPRAPPLPLALLEPLPSTVPQEARAPLRRRGGNGAAHLALLTDLGHASAHVLAHLAGAHALLLESNHDPQLLAGSRYPSFLKRRVGGDYGHLSNAAAAGILRAVQHPGLQCVVAAHLSAQNNHPDLVRPLLAQALGWAPERIGVASALQGSDWHAVGP